MNATHTMNTLVRTGSSDTATDTDADTATHTATATKADTRPRPATRDTRDADGMAVASFVLGLAGLLVFNFVLGPCALVLAGLALLRGTTRRTRAVLGLALGAADLIVLASVTAADHAASWSITG